MSDPATCKHLTRTCPWVMQPVTGGETRLVYLCNCGQTRPARLGIHGAQAFENMALAYRLNTPPFLEVVFGSRYAL